MRNEELDVRQGKLLRQRHGGDVLQDPEIRARLATIFYTRQEADQAIGRYIDGFYNPLRRHSALDFTSPALFEKTVAERPNASLLKRGKSSAGLPAAIDGEQRYRDRPKWVRALLSCNRSWRRTGASSRVRKTRPRVRSCPEVLTDASAVSATAGASVDREPHDIGRAASSFPERAR